MRLHELPHMEPPMRWGVTVSFSHGAGQTGLTSGVAARRAVPLVLRGVKVAGAGLYVIPLWREGIDRACREAGLGAALQAHITEP